MKKYLKVVIILLCICFSLSKNLNISYCYEVTAPPNIVKDYYFNELLTISSKVDFIGKNIVSSNLENNIEKKNEFLKDIKFLVNDINYLISQASSKYKEYENDTYTLNGLYAINLILSEFRFALSQLNNYLLANTADEKYNSLASFFIINSEANRKLNVAKKLIK